MRMMEKVKIQHFKVINQSPKWDINEESLKEMNKRLVKMMAMQLRNVMIAWLYQMTIVRNQPK